MNDFSFLFRDLTDEDYRESPFDGAKGYMFGGMGHPTKYELSQQYFDAANVLMNEVEKNEIEDYRVSNPVLFLHRHSLELLLKSMLPGAKKKHRLNDLFEEFRSRSEPIVGRFPKWIRQTILALDAYDPQSTAFRYGETGDSSVPGEVIIGHQHLRKVMKDLRSILIRVNERCAVRFDSPPDPGVTK